MATSAQRLNISARTVIYPMDAARTHWNNGATHIRTKGPANAGTYHRGESGRVRGALKMESDARQREETQR